MTKLDLTGKKFGKLTVIQESLLPSNRKKWDCICGNTVSWLSRAGKWRAYIAINEIYQPILDKYEQAGGKKKRTIKW